MAGVNIGDLMQVVRHDSFDPPGFLKVGALVTVRALGGPADEVFFHGKVRVDNGDPGNGDLLSNHFTQAAWVPADSLEPSPQLGFAFGGPDVDT